jgi:hypothetical protein
VAFPAGRFTQTPVITLAQSGLPGGSGTLIPKYTGASATGFTCYAYTGNGATTTATVTIVILAVQMTSGSGTG